MTTVTGDESRAKSSVHDERVADRNFLAHIRQRITESAGLEPSFAVLADEQRILPKIAQCFGWGSDGWWDARWPNGIKGSAIIYRRDDGKHLCCIRQKHRDGTVKVHSFELGRAYALRHGLPKQLSKAALHTWRRRLFVDAKLWPVKLPLFITPSVEQMAMLRGDVKIHLTLLAGLRLQSAISDPGWEKVPYTAKWARAWNYYRLPRGTSLKRITRGLRDLVGAGLIKVNRGRHYWITPPLAPDRGLKLEQLRDLLTEAKESTFDKVVALLNLGKTQAQTARELGVSRTAVCKHARHARDKGLLTPTQCITDPNSDMC